MIRRAQGGDIEVLPQLRVLLDTRPDLWEHYGNLAHHAQQSWIDRIGGLDLFVKESLDRQVKQLKNELAGPSPTPLEGLLADRVAACWLQVYHADLALAQVMGSSYKLVEFLGRRQARVHRSFIASIGALAMIRRLTPTVAYGDQDAQSAARGHELTEMPGGATGPDGRPQLRLVVPDEPSASAS
jgi:hypothetical protein